MENTLSRKSCSHNQPIHYYDYILELLENGRDVDVIYINFAKAFDKVDFTVTLNKANDLNIKG